MSSYPIAILILDNDGYKTYLAYVPLAYNESNDRDTFLARVYNHIAYDHTDALNNKTNTGKLLEVHHRFIDTVVPPRSPLCYFSTYIHQNCNYKPIHVNSPIFFNVDEAEQYNSSKPELCHMSCQLRFI